MLNLIKYINWVISRKKIENDLLNYCKLEYRPHEVDFAFKQALNQQKTSIFGSV